MCYIVYPGPDWSLQLAQLTIARSVCVDGYVWNMICMKQYGGQKDVIHWKDICLHFSQNQFYFKTQTKHPLNKSCLPGLFATSKVYLDYLALMSV